MTLPMLDMCRFAWFGGKRHASPLVWEALGDVHHYVEPFAGSMAVLLTRPHRANRSYYSETVNDLDGLLVNFWRAVTMDPQGTARAASWPVSELDKHARSCALLRWRETEMPALLAGDPHAHDPIMAGWWAWAVSVQIGAWGLHGPWWPDETGRLRKWRVLPLVEGSGGTRAPGVPGDRPHLSHDGQGVCRPGTRAPATPGGLPHLSSNGQGVCHAGTRAPDVSGLLMPELLRWFDWLSARLRHVRIVNGDWARTVTSGAALSQPVRQGKGPVGVFLDPPYGDVGRASLYGKHEDMNVAAQVRDWALTRGDDPQWRIVYAGYDVEGADLEAAGWRAVEWFAKGHLRGGMGNVAGSEGHQQHRERLWMSPHCLNPREELQQSMFNLT